ncbi:lysophospholipid acyltransferase family protein [Oleidesulfovibrio sp.]|uniref:lysophospholipid acyltransferase family protein n=1 Tax=Oleidesulfovibrio sp. TaxID=2909707 RepID=UPI003A8773EC
MKISPSLVCPPLYGLYKAWCSTLHYNESGREEIDALWARKEPMVFALWHDELFPLMHVKRDLAIVTVVSQSQDGEYLAGVLSRLGLHTARGSSSRGGVKALLQASRMMRNQGLCGCITVDGPRGPRHKVKEGAIFLAQRTPAHVVPVRILMANSKKFEKAWDKFQLPLPFSDIHIHYGKPYTLEANSLEAEEVTREVGVLQNKLDALGKA